MFGFSPCLLKGKTVLVTGAGKGIGFDCVRHAAKAGASVIAVSRTQSDLDELRSLYPKQIECWCEDVSSDQFIRRLNQLDILHGLVNNVGTNKVSPIEKQPLEDVDTVIDLNIKSLYRTTKAAITPMRKANQGAIVNMSSQMGFVGSAGRTLYCMSKHGVEGFTKALAVELAESNIRVNSVAPTFVQTPLTQPMLEDPEFKQFVLDMIPLNKLATTSDVANACTFLLSDLSSMITGTSIKVDGGWTAR
ncbi:SDR family NAD(P)-dependent oxidoreductase [Agaribacter flavus]|uniref:SDR family NAD(P)-dependent oxidoreductase n=1 Tax=Agaribacter flavus TaxID=1902781 RepID=A0ABV7FVF1_9ALTE